MISESHRSTDWRTGARMARPVREHHIAEPEQPGWLVMLELIGGSVAAWMLLIGGGYMLARVVFG